MRERNPGPFSGEQDVCQAQSGMASENVSGERLKKEVFSSWLHIVLPLISCDISLCVSLKKEHIFLENA